MSPEITARLRLGGLLVLALVLQTTVVPDLRILGVCADLLLLCTVCAALVGGPELGGLVGFSAGLLADLFLTTTPLGLSALAFSVVGYAVGSVRRTVLQEGWLLAPATALVASTAGVIIFVLAGAMIGQSQLTKIGPVDIVKTALLVGVMNAVIAAPVCRVVAWAASASQGSPGSRGSLGSMGSSFGSQRAGQAGSEISSTAARHSLRLASRPAHIRTGRSASSGRGSSGRGGFSRGGRGGSGLSR